LEVCEDHAYDIGADGAWTARWREHAGISGQKLAWMPERWSGVRRPVVVRACVTATASARQSENENRTRELEERDSRTRCLCCLHCLSAKEVETQMHPASALEAMSSIVWPASVGESKKLGHAKSLRLSQILGEV